MMLQANIPLEKTEKMKPFLQKYCRYGGSLPHASHLRQKFVPQVSEKKRAKVNELISDAVLRNVVMAINPDESTDAADRSLLNIMLSFEGQTFLLQSDFLEAPLNHAELARIVSSAMVKFGIEKCVKLYITDNAEYCHKSYTDILSKMYPDMLWVPCAAHFVNLCAGTWQTFFELTNKFLHLMRRLFKKKTTASRRRRWIEFLKRHGNQSPRQPPRPGFTRWTAWFTAVNYYLEFFEFIYDFVCEERETCGTSYIDELCDIFREKSSLSQLEIELSFISDNAGRMVQVIELFERKDIPVAHLAYDSLRSLEAFLENGKSTTTFGAKTDPLLNGKSQKEKSSWHKSFHGAYDTALTKLSKHLKRYTALDFIEAVRVFNPRKMSCFNAVSEKDIKNFESIHGLKDPNYAVLDEWSSYLILCRSYTGEDILQWWADHEQEMPYLSSLARQNLTLPLSSAEVERSFSIYNHIFSDRRRTLTEENTKNLLNVYYNL